MTVAEQDTTLSDQAFNQVAAIAISDAGLSIPISKKALVQSRIGRRLRVLGLSSVTDYIRLLKDDPRSSERKELISILTTNVSSFYRESHHFQHLLADVFPSLKKKVSNGGTVRLWSAGCSSGQEPYTIGIEVLKSFSADEANKILILATDIDPGILNRAREGVYSAADLEAIPARDKKEYFQSQGDRYGACEQLKSLVRFRELNLHADWPMKGSFDAVFCRNVVIYFDDRHQQALWPRFHKVLSQNGHLYLGHSERIHPLENSGFSSVGATIYQKTT